MQDLVYELEEHKIVRIDFKYYPSNHMLKTLANKAVKETKARLDKDISHIRFYQVDNPNHPYASCAFDISAPKTNKEAKQFLSDNLV